MIEALQPPRPTGLIREVRAVLEFPLLVLRSIDLARQPRGHGEPVLVLPGYGAGDGSTAILKTYLRLLGYRVSGWHLGRSSGNVPDLLPRVLRRILSMSRKSQQPVRVIGWSFGGYLAREAARERPEAIHQVITLGTPVIGGPKYTVAASAFYRRGVDLDAMAAEIETRNKILLRTPVTAIYSRGDAFVAWEACIDHHGSNVEHVEVRTTHMGFGFSPQVFKIIAQRLANEVQVGPNPSPSRPRRRRRH
ncbi:MAG: alpha/beta fold hydrolase [Deltaproteobacteria bacterium]|nr:alpha/beta fold hydrolase [Deltaproteobacteria bacterium]MDZ4346100.1 alpha/beta fold hydrolase [Candidatus Binatia bacterium]